MKNKERNKVIIIICMGMFLVLSAFWGGYSHAGETIKTKIVLKYGSYFVQCDMDDPLLWWGKEVAKRSLSKGIDIKFEYYWAGALAKPKDHLSALGMGVYDLGWITPAINAAQLPLSTITADAFWSQTDLERVMMATDEFARGPAKAELEKANVHYICPFGAWDYFLIGAKPFKSFADAKRYRARTFGSLAIGWKELGGVPVAMPMPESYSALHSGIIDGILSPVPTMRIAKFYELGKYVSEVPFGPGGSVFVMNMDTWNKLPESVKKIITEIRKEMPSKIHDMAKNRCFADLEWMEKNAGVKISRLSQEDQARIPAIKEKVWAEIAASFDDKGLPGTETLKVWDQILEKYRTKK